MGGGLGGQLVGCLHSKLGDKAEIIALGTNAVATSSMMRAGACRGATGENAIRLSVAKANIIVGPIGIVIPNTMMGEISPVIAESVANCDAHKVLLPVNNGHFEIIGLDNQPLGQTIKSAVEKVMQIIRERTPGQND
jgi:hypothetical protein